MTSRNLTERTWYNQPMYNDKLQELFLRYMDRFVDLEFAKDQAFAKWKSYKTMGNSRQRRGLQYLRCRS
jgi:hypothetical protein